MSEVIKEQQTVTKWFAKQIDIKTVIMIVGGLITAMLTTAFFYWNTHLNWDKGDQTEKRVSSLEKSKVDREEFLLLKEQVQRQYTSAKEDRDKEFKAIEEVADWMHYEKGRQQGIAEATKK